MTRDLCEMAEPVRFQKLLNPKPTGLAWRRFRRANQVEHIAAPKRKVGSFMGYGIRHSLWRAIRLDLLPEYPELPAQCENDRNIYHGMPQYLPRLGTSPRIMSATI